MLTGLIFSRMGLSTYCIALFLSGFIYFELFMYGFTSVRICSGIDLFLYRFIDGIDF